MLWHILQTFGSKVSKCIQKQTPTQFSAMSPLGWPYRGTLECPQGTYPNREQSRCSYCNRFGPYGDVEKTTATTGERVGLVLKSQVLYGYYYDEQFDVFSHKSSLWNSKTRVYFINFSAWRKKYVYIYIYTNCFQKTIGSKIAISTMPRDVERNSHCKCLVCVLTLRDPKASFWLAFVASMPRIWKQRILPKNSGKKILESFVVVGALVWRARFYTSNPFILRSWRRY